MNVGPSICATSEWCGADALVSFAAPDRSEAGHEPMQVALDSQLTSINSSHLVGEGEDVVREAPLREDLPHCRRGPERGWLLQASAVSAPGRACEMTVEQCKP